MAYKTDRKVSPETIKLLGIPFGSTSDTHYFRVVPVDDGYVVQRKSYNSFRDWEPHPRSTDLTVRLDETLQEAAIYGLYLVSEEDPEP